MKVIRSRDIYYIARDVLKCLDPKIVNHGSRTAYILARMLQCANKYEMFEIAEFAYIATFHDIGAYKTNEGADQLFYETQDTNPHSEYGYLFFKYGTPFKDRAKIMLYHHTDYKKVPKDECPFYDVIDCLNIAEKSDIYSNAMGEKFDSHMFDKQAGTVFSPVAIALLHQAEKRYNIFEKLYSGEYKQESNEIFDYLIFTNQEKEDLLRGLMFSVGLRSEYSLSDMAICVNVADQIGKRMLLTPDEQEILYYASLVHDAGMLSVDKEIFEAPRKLTEEEIKIVRSHVDMTESIIRDRIEPAAYEIALAHHERCDGSGYPKRLKDNQMNLMQKILQVADTVSGMTSRRSYREPKSKNQVIEILKEEAAKGRLAANVVRTFINNYDDIMNVVDEKANESLLLFRKIQSDFERLEAKKTADGSENSRENK